jgi:hypothetical protein
MSKNLLLEYQRQLSGDAWVRRCLCAARPTRSLGILARPLGIQIGHLLKPEKPKWYHGNAKEWGEDVRRIRQRESAEWCDRERALASFCKVDYREPDFSDPWYRVALKLGADRFIGLQSGDLGTAKVKRAGRGANPSLTKIQTKMFAGLVSRALKRGSETDSGIAKFIVDENIIWVPTRGCGPKKKGKPGGKNIGRSSALNYVAKMRGAWRSVCSGEANGFQAQVVSLALDELADWPLWSVIFQQASGVKGTAPTK